MPLNYNEVQSIYRNEKNTPALQHVGENFYQELQEFLFRLGDEHKSYMNKLAQEIIERRRNKVVMQAMRTNDASPLNATSEEITLYKEMVELFARYREKLDKAPLREEVGIKEETKAKVKQDDGKIRIRILQPMPAIIGSDSKHYGPFKENEEVGIPKETAEILIEKGMAEEV